MIVISLSLWLLVATGDTLFRVERIIRAVRCYPLKTKFIHCCCKVGLTQRACDLFDTKTLSRVCNCFCFCCGAAISIVVICDHNKPRYFVKFAALRQQKTYSCCIRFMMCVTVHRTISGLNLLLLVFLVRKSQVLWTWFPHAVCSVLWKMW